MRQLRRLACPPILKSKAVEWTQRYLAKCTQDPKPRPTKSQYGHPEILKMLAAMSHKKCFYCERLLTEKQYTVDHYVEVSEARDKAFEWDNLYLCCCDCQDKLAEDTVTRAECLDPCDPQIDPADHMTFEDEYIRPRNDSHRGRQTIRKYQLDRDDLQLQRIRQLKQFHKVLLALKDQQIEQRRNYLNDTERDGLQSFAAPEAPFSLMFRDLLRALL
jgi:uncharacterized protein (TIGR02646 family)